VTYGVCRFLEIRLPLTKSGSILVVLIAGGIGIAVYAAML
jgi:hypothetical protein